MTDHPTLNEQDWDIRLYIYHELVRTGQAPSHQLIAEYFGIPVASSRQALHRLHNAHLLFLKPNTDDVMMVFPLSAVPTNYQVTVNGVQLYANCAWDSLGIPAMLGKDAQVRVTHPITRESITYAIQDGQLRTVSNGYIHFALPFADWYNDLIDT